MQLKLDKSSLFSRDKPPELVLDELDSYLRIAYIAISLARRPLHATEILSIAQKYEFIPAHLSGKTPHKTLNARLAEHIHSEGSSALFFRTGPATYFIASLAEERFEDNAFQVFHGERRSKKIKNENVLVAPKRELAARIWGDHNPFDEAAFERLYNDICFFEDRRRAEFDDSIKQFVTFSLFKYGSRLLTYRRGRYTSTSEDLRDCYSIGFGGHINDQDFDLFNVGSEAIKYNSSRELYEELYLDHYYQTVDEISQRSRVLGYINVDEGTDAQHHVAVLVVFDHISSSLPTKGELSINELQWFNIEDRVNDIAKFDLWSRIILKNIYEGRYPEIHDG